MQESLFSLVKTRKYNEERITKNLKINYYIPSTFRNDYKENTYNLTKVNLSKINFKNH